MKESDGVRAATTAAMTASGRPGAFLKLSPRLSSDDRLHLSTSTGRGADPRPASR